MSENNNNGNFNKDDFTAQFNEFINKTVKTVQDYGKVAIDKLDAEKQKAQVRSEIGHNARDLSKTYEKLGQAYYEAKTNGTEVVGEKEMMDLIRSKEKLIELLNEKLDSLGA